MALTSPIHINDLLFRSGNGIKLISPKDAHHYMQSSQLYNTGYTVEQVMNLPFNFYFLNKAGETLQMNAACVEICGFQSSHDSIGKSLFDVSLQDSAKELIENCNVVIAENKIKIFEEHNLRNDGTAFAFLSIKSPWYGKTDEIIGTFGCSIVLGKHSLSESLITISQLGLLNSDGFTFKNTLLQNTVIERTQLSDRENLCVQHLCKGYTLKEIAKLLVVSPKTVETYIDRAKQKLHCSNKAELIAEYLKLF